MKRISFVSVLSLSATAMLFACNESGSKGVGVVQPLADSTVILKYNGGTITAKDVNPQIKSQISELNEQAMESYKEVARRVLLMKLLEAEAKKQNLPNPQALMQKVAAEATVTDEFVKDFYNKQGLAKGIPDPRNPGKMRKISMPELKGILAQREQQQRQQAYAEGLLGQANAQLALDEPRIEVKLNGQEPFAGSANAKVVVQEFSDFECPFCERGKKVVDQIKQHYGDKVKMVFRHYPLMEKHPGAMPAAIASMCAHRQGKFWALHDKFFENQQGLNDEGINKMAKEVGLDMAKFEPCFKNGETAGDVRKDMEVAGEVGVNATPTFFVNGRKIAGAASFEHFKSLIDADLAK